ncbi:PREDICTED: Fanconi anemia core complex-associated protein 100, partial [Myotis davidii]|uniref:Fanconi anemia core complex-associated protein 100 n=1 Tax=Myotis davidii TaxID=225400 RepID=UPI0003EC670C
VYRFPGQVWHLEALALRRALLVLCARRGIYCLSLDQARRSVSQSDGDDEDCESPSPVTPVDPDTCVLPDATLCAFTVLGDLLIALAQGPAQWKVQLFECPSPGADPGPRGQIGEVELSTHMPPAGSPGKSQAPHFRPVLCCVSLPSSRARHSPPQGPKVFTLEGPLFGLLFGADAALLESPVILCGLPDGQLCSVVLKTLVTSRSAPGDPKALVRILHHLEEPVAFIGALRTEPSAEGPEDADLDCLVALGHHGRTLAIKASWDEAGSLVPELREYCLPGPVLCAACSGDSHSDGPGGLPPLLCPTSLGVCSVVTLSVSSRSPAGGTELLALSTKGRLMTCCLDLSREPARPPRVTAADTGRKIKDLLCGIGTVSESLGVCSVVTLSVSSRSPAVPQEQVLPQRGADAVGRWPVLGGRCRWAETSFAQEGGGQPARSWHEASPVLQVAVADLCPAGPVQAVEIQVESSSLANMCRAHHAVIGRMQRMVVEQAARGSSPPDLRVQYLHQIQANHEPGRVTLLRSHLHRALRCLGHCGLPSEWLRGPAPATTVMSCLQLLPQPSRLHPVPASSQGSQAGGAPLYECPLPRQVAQGSRA